MRLYIYKNKQLLDEYEYYYLKINKNKNLIIYALLTHEENTIYI